MCHRGPKAIRAFSQEKSAVLWDALGYSRGNLIEKMATHNLRVGGIGARALNASYIPPWNRLTCKLLELIQSGAIAVTVLDQGKGSFWGANVF